MRPPICLLLPALALPALVLPALAPCAFAQEKPIEFRLIADKANMGGCTRWDPQMSRVHTVTPMGTTAELRSAGGINDTLKQTEPHVFQSTVSLGTTTMFIVANATKHTLDVTEKSLGCRWNAVAP